MWELLLRVIKILNESKIQYMLVGSFAANMHGHSRATHDIDFVIRITKEEIIKLKDAFGDEYMFDVESASEALLLNEMFNVIDYQTMDKIDFWIPKETEFARTQFSRRIKQELEDSFIWIESVEDTILSKLLWHKMSNSERQLNDVKAILLANNSLDWEYLNKWALHFDIKEILNKLNEENINV